MNKQLALGCVLAASSCSALAGLSLPPMPDIAIDPVGFSGGIETGSAFSMVNQQARFHNTNAGNTQKFNQSDSRSSGMLNFHLDHTWALEGGNHFSLGLASNWYSSHVNSMNHVDSTLVSGTGPLDLQLISRTQHQWILGGKWKHYITDRTNLNLGAGLVRNSMRFRMHIVSGQETPIESTSGPRQTKAIWGGQFGMGAEHFVTPKHSINAGMDYMVFSNVKLDNFHNFYETGANNDRLLDRKMKFTMPRMLVGYNFYF